ncbi:MAG: hypothetical protein R6X09_05125 [Bacteroidales bacterium]
MEKNILTLITVTVICIFSSCVRAQNDQKTEKQTANFEVTDIQKDTEEIQKLIQRVLSWSESKESVDLLPILADSKDSVYVGFDMDKLKENLNKLKETSFFSSEFIENYNQIILTLDRKLKNKEYIEWLIGDLPPFRFANDCNPWWNGQEYFSLQLVIVEKINLSKDEGEFYFKCGSMGNDCSGLEGYKTRFRVVKRENKWKISYMQGFDYSESTKKDGEI